MSPTNPSPSQDRTIQIADKDATLSLDYDGARARHKGDSWWGVAVGFRAMQIAARKLSQSKLWHRDQLTVISGHPGPGVVDAINYVTGAVERRRFRLTDPQAGKRGCSRDMKYQWWVNDGTTTVAINLHPEFVPEPFYELLDRLGTDHERQEDRALFDSFKSDLEARIWSQSLDASFNTDCSPVL